MLMIGEPGCGKTMIAQRIPTILPEMTEEECLEVTKIYSHGIFKENGEIEIDCHGTIADLGENRKEESKSQLQSYYLTKLREGIQQYGNC